MKHLTALLTALTFTAVSTTAFADYRSSVDDQGCWDGLDSYGNDCVVKNDSWWNDGKLTLELKNRCSHRVYVQACLGKKDSNWDDCGAFHIGAGRTYRYYTYRANGDANWNWIGSTKSSQDWVCRDRADF